MRADLIIRNGHIVGMDADVSVHVGGAVVISGDRIVATGPASVTEGFTAPQEIDAEGGPVIPGLTDSHCHFAMTPFRGLGEGLPNRLERFMRPLERDMIDGDLVVAGTTCVVDSDTYPERRALAADETPRSQGWGAMPQEPWQNQIDLFREPGEFTARAPAADEVYTPEILALTQDSRPRLG